MNSEMKPAAETTLLTLHRDFESAMTRVSRREAYVVMVFMTERSAKASVRAKGKSGGWNRGATAGSMSKSNQMGWPTPAQVATLDRHVCACETSNKRVCWKGGKREGQLELNQHVYNKDTAKHQLASSKVLPPFNAWYLGVI